MNFTIEQQTVLFQINNLRTDDHTPTRAEIEKVVDSQALQALVDRCDVAFDATGNLVYTPAPRRGITDVEKLSHAVRTAHQAGQQRQKRLPTMKQSWQNQSHFNVH